MSGVIVCAPPQQGWPEEVIYFLSWADQIMFVYNFCWIVYLLGYEKKPKGYDFFAPMFLVYEGTLWLLYAVCFLLLYLIRWFRPFGDAYQLVCPQGSSQSAIFWSIFNVYAAPDPLSVPLFVLIAYLIYFDFEQSGRQRLPMVLIIFNAIFFPAYYVCQVLLQRMYFVQVVVNGGAIVVLFVLVGVAMAYMIRHSPKDLLGVPRWQFVRHMQIAREREYFHLESVRIDTSPKGGEDATPPVT